MNEKDEKIFLSYCRYKKTATFATAIERDSNKEMKFWCVSSVG